MWIYTSIIVLLIPLSLNAKEYNEHFFKHNKIIIFKGMYDSKPISVDTLKELLVFTEYKNLNDSTRVYKDYYICDSCNKKLVIKTDTIYKKINTIEMFLLRTDSIKEKVYHE